MYQKMSKEAVLLGLNQDYELNKARMMGSMNLFDTNLERMVHGHGTVKRTEDYCMLEQLRHVQDVWAPFKIQMQKVVDGDTSVPALLWLSKNQWDAGVDGKYAEFMEVMESLRTGQGTCKASLTPSREELENALRGIGHLRELSQQMVKELLFVKAGIPTNFTDASVDGGWTSTLRRLISGARYMEGSESMSMPSPSSQAVANGIWGVYDLDWVTRFPLMSADNSK